MTQRTPATKARVPHSSQSHRDEWDVRRRVLVKFGLVLTLAFAAPAPAQQLIGYVSTKDADIAGASDVLDGHAVLSGSVAVTAKDHTAPITLGRGGNVQVCQTSILHLTESKAAPTDGQVSAPLLLSLDRGAIEVQMVATATDAVMTPDLRFAVRAGGPLDLRLRIARNGDTCVENRGPQAPTLAVSDPFGEALYELRPGQHVLFEHGSVHEVVDHETIPCGCPEPLGISVADALLATSLPGGRSPSAAEQHPFPAAISEGLAPAPEVPQAPPGQVHAQVTDTLSFNAKPDPQPANPAPPPPPAQSKPPSPPDASRDLAHAIGHFFRKLFGHA
jgi:hypothetical protein